MNEVLKQRFNKVIPRIESPNPRNNAGLGDDIGFYIFDYPPEEELEVCGRPPTEQGGRPQRRASSKGES